MPKSNLAKYDPRDESSESAKDYWFDGERGYDPDKTLILIKPEEDGCACGCGGKPEGKGRSFRMGHDARLKGKLIRAHLTDTAVVVVDGGTLRETSAAKLAKKLGWQDYLDEAAQREADRKKEREERAATRSKASSGPKVGDKTTVKVGRWDKEATVVGVFDDSIEYEYVDGKGKAQRITRPRS